MSITTRTTRLLLGIGVVLALNGCGDEEKAAQKAAESKPAAPVLKSDLEQFSYSIGVLIAHDMKSKGMSELDERTMGMAIRDVLDGKPMQLTEEQMGQALEKMSQKILEEHQAKAKAAAAAAIAAGEKFRAENGAKEGVVTLPNGIQYKVLTEGTGEKPTLESTVVAHYNGTFIDGTVFDSSYERGEPVTFALNQVIKGWQEVVPMMGVGSKWQVVIPPELAYGEKGAPPKIAGNSTLVFDIELIDIKKPEAAK